MLNGRRKRNGKKSKRKFKVNLNRNYGKPKKVKKKNAFQIPLISALFPIYLTDDDKFVIKTHLFSRIIKTSISKSLERF